MDFMVYFVTANIRVDIFRMPSYGMHNNLHLLATAAAEHGFVNFFHNLDQHLLQLEKDNGKKQLKAMKPIPLHYLQLYFKFYGLCNCIAFIVFIIEILYAQFR